MSAMIITPLDNIEIRDNGLIKLDLEKLNIPKSFIYQYVISIPPLVIGGNHKHDHQEIFFSTDENLEVHWINSRGEKKMAKFKEGNKLSLFQIPSGIPHAVINTSSYKPAVLVEFADRERKNVEKTVII